MSKKIFYAALFALLFSMNSCDNEEVVFDLPEDPDVEAPDDDKDDDKEDGEGGDENPDPAPKPWEGKYTNPLTLYKDGSISSEALIWDPSILWDGNKFYVYSTEEGWNDDGFRPYVGVFSSENLVDWKFEGGALDEYKNAHSDLPWVRCTDITKDGNMYYLHVYGDNDIRCFNSKSPTGGFDAFDNDKGIIVLPDGVAVSGDTYPFIFKDNGQIYLIATISKGEERGVGMIKMKSYTEVSANPEVTIIPESSDLQNPTIVKIGDTYYLIGKKEGYWGVKDIIVMKSSSLTNGYSEAKTIVNSSDALNGIDGFIKDDNGDYWCLYSTGVGRNSRMYLDKINFDADGYPYVNEYKPSTTEQTAPFFSWLQEGEAGK